MSLGLKRKVFEDIFGPLSIGCVTDRLQVRDGGGGWGSWGYSNSFLLTQSLTITANTLNIHRRTQTHINTHTHKHTYQTNKY